MDIIYKIFEKYPVLKQIFLYGIIGLFSSSIDTISFILLRHINTELFAANFIGINIGIIISFFLNTYFNFKTTDKMLKRIISFFIVGYIGMLLSMAIMFIGTTVLEINEIVVKIMSVFIVAACQFVMNKLVTFRKGKTV